MREHVKTSEGRGKSEKGGKEGQTKKPFDKKRYRLQKYSNKYKINQWEERRKKATIRNFYKELQKEQRDTNGQKISALTANKHEEAKNASPKPKVSAFRKAKEEYLRKKDEKRKKIAEALRTKAEREEALKKYKQKKMQTFKALNKKTKKGQPVMKDRLEMLLEKIQQNVS
ncbi:hypothetical protein KM043_004850 [Ampulex compressa]|nr:hypothetical protein KM043_004850 [Ampulex compressa]